MTDGALIRRLMRKKTYLSTFFEQFLVVLNLKYLRIGRNLRMVCDEDCRTAVLGKTERTVGWEGDGDPIMTGLVRHCKRGTRSN